ncbi:hypothetical protein [Sporomusa acidovorans]|nr:hypothetical protein [Sporomusa acidovorans]
MNSKKDLNVVCEGILTVTRETIRIFDGAVAIITGGASGIGAALGRLI